MNAIISIFLLASAAHSGFGFPNLRIIGGDDAKIEDFPYQVAISIDLTKCGGAILDELHVLTSAQCVFEFTSNNTKILAGSSNRSDNVTEVDVVNVFLHPDFKIGRPKADVAVLKLAESLNFTESINKTELADKTFKEETGSNATLVGYGWVSDLGPEAKTLQKVDLQIFETKDCQKIYSKYQVTDDIFCAGPLDGSKDACYGDTGSPLVQDGKVIGIAQNYLDCGEHPGKYTRISEYKDFIDEVIKN